MNLIVCIDKNNGIMFNNRRVSQDKEVTSKILELTNNSKLFVTSYSSKLFEGFNNLVIDDFSNISEIDFIFIEDNEIPLEGINTLYVFNWNRDYPADKFFDIDLSNYKKESKEDIVGSSHKKVTLTVYRGV